MFGITMTYHDLPILHMTYRLSSLFSNNLSKIFYTTNFARLGNMIRFENI